MKTKEKNNFIDPKGQFLAVIVKLKIGLGSF